MITRTKNIAVPNFKEKPGFGMFGNWYGRACVLKDNFPASLAVRDPRMTKSMSNLLKNNIKPEKYFKNQHVPHRKNLL